jgi:hypothetical protein
MLGYCGINCEACPAYQGTVTSNQQLLEKASAESGKEAASIRDWVCVGCTPADQPFLATYCAGCSIRTCAIEQGVANCAACDAYDVCSRIRDFMGTEPAELARRMGWLRDRFLTGRANPGVAP